MGTITKFDPSCDEISLRERAELKLELARQRCEIEIRARTTALKVHLELSEELLLQRLQSSHDEIMDKLHKFSLRKNSQGQEETVNFDLGFSSNTKDDVSVISTLHGLVCHDDVLPSDLSLELVTGITQLKPGAAIMLKVTSLKPILKDIILTKLSFSAVNAITSDDSSVKFQKKICSPSEMKMRIKASEEGQYVISTKLYGQHVTNSPVIVPVMDYPEKHLAEMGIFLADINSSKFSDESRMSAGPVKVDKFTQYEANTLDETMKVAEEGNLEETELRVCIGVERDGDTFIDYQDFKEITDSQGAMFNESKGLHQSRDVIDTDRNDVADFMIQTGCVQPLDDEDDISAMSLPSTDSLNDPLRIPPAEKMRRNFVTTNFLNTQTNIVIVVHLPSDMDDHGLGALFSAVAPVESACVARDEKSSNCLGFGHVRYFHSKNALIAVKILDLFPISQENILRVSLYYHGITRIKKFERTNLLIKNIPPGTKQRDVYRRFVKFGPLASCSPIFPGDLAYVRYERVTDAMSALAYNDGLPFGNSTKKLVVAFNTLMQII